MPRAKSSTPAKDTPLTHDDNPAAPNEPPVQDVSLSLIAIANPAFRFSFLGAGFHRAKWPAPRRKPTGRRVRPDAPDLDEQQEELDSAAESGPAD